MDGYMPRNSTLDASYKSTSYIAELPDEIFLRGGQPFPALDERLSTHKSTIWAFITAWNPYSRPQPAIDNAYRHQQLLALLSEYRIWPGKGVPENHSWEPEKSLLVVGISKDAQ